MAQAFNKFEWTATRSVFVGIFAVSIMEVQILADDRYRLLLNGIERHTNG